jgi:hypothetical protein
MTLQTRLVGSSRRRIEFNPGIIGCSNCGDLINFVRPVQHALGDCQAAKMNLPIIAPSGDIFQLVQL